MRSMGLTLMMLNLIQGGMVVAQERATDAANASVDAPDAKAKSEDPLSTITNSAANKKFSGSPITLNLKDADVHDVLRMISEASGFNIIIHPAVAGKVTVALDNVPWDQALDVVMTTLRLGAERSDSVLRVMPKDLLVQEKQAELDATRVASLSAPRITRVFPVSYSDLGQLSGILQSFSSAQNTTGGASGIPALITTDPNTQSVVVRDTAEGVERMKKLIQLLDVQTPQIIIDSKVIDATEAFSKTIDGKFSVQSGSNSISINGAAAALGGSSGSGTGSPSNANTVKMGVGGAFSLNAILNYSEGENKAKVISSPKIMVLSGKTATITQGSNLAVKQSTATATGILETTTFVPYSTSLTVTPRAANDGSVFMKLNLTRDTVQTDASSNTSVAPRNINTEVIVDSGNTLVLGGVQSMSEIEASAGFPFLRKIPIIGWLFGQETATRDKTELMFFVTPRVLNLKRSGITDAEEGKKSTHL